MIILTTLTTQRISVCSD